MPLHCTTALLTLATLHFNTLTQFYRQFLDLEPAVLLPNVYAEFHLPNLKLGIFCLKTTQNSKAETQNLKLKTQNSMAGMSLCLEVEDLEVAIAHLTQLDCSPPGEIITASHGREIYAYDPDGNWLILHQATVTYNKS